MKIIDATRGKPHTEQVALANELINAPLSSYIAEGGADIRNYSISDGLPEMKRIFAELLNVDASEVIVGGNSSLNLMFDCFATFVLARQWDTARAKFICPAPGYDRHFSICEYFGVEMLTVDMTENGPDMDAVEKHAADPDVVGMWCVPVFSNPQGYVYSDETIARLAKMKTAHPHFKILWDDAYTIHHFSGARPKILSIMAECRKNNNESRPVIFTSFSKISVAGAGISCLAAAGEAAATLRKRIATQTIGPDKVNQQRHINFFKDAKGIEAHMQKHATILRPKFEYTIEYMEKHLQGTGATFTKPRGGYFISVETPPNCAKRVCQICKENGVLITNAGATFPYGKDPADTNLRFAPTFLSMDELKKSLEVFCEAVKAAAEE
ncbi:MAG: aminotransferase class I/II-fold pyridoxal phosphate-dependent enzyme [Defluviitaleaceae bacterium]|nr:aminotransferase class I/II-fold pyridoxal phosphate-dependent enzyme [Defluviitaleaceae bacterium]